ncbi:hypothetical protein F5884DRAFT_717897 [Xylogone sp. PMI_703]|nr:hypothetical protein F5884DRAFT_717897 [Xylogone sp. PMI_703]
MTSSSDVLHPPSLSDTTNSSLTPSAKRKRDDSLDEHGHTNGVANTKPAMSGMSKEESQILVRDLVDVLKGYDTSPSVLSHQLPEHSSSTEPHTKRQKSEPPTEESSILERCSADTYTSIDDALRDIDAAVSDIFESLKLPNGAAQYAPLPATKIELSMRLAAFKKKAHELVQNEKTARETRDASGTNGTMRTAIYNGGLGSGAFTRVNASSADNKFVLTLFGHSVGTAKQMFSSLQIPKKIDGEDVYGPLREIALPNGITTTQVVPIRSTGLSSDKKRVQTLGEAFSAPPLSLPIPKPSKAATTRSSTVGWYHPAAPEPVLSRNASYFRQPISTGQWLDYSNATPPHSGKKRSRERTMSFSAGKNPHSESDKAEIEAAKLDALFRGAYSGFAPTKDDSAAIAPEGIVSRIWWQQSGEKNFERLVKSSENLDSDMSEISESAADNEMEEFQKMVEEWGPEVIDPNLEDSEVATEKTIQEKEVDEILDEISGLIETLHSYQRIRHLSLNAPNRLLSAPDMKNIGTPTIPSESELMTYEILKSQLVLMISSLPPYAVAKLNSDQLSELSISTKLEIHLDDFKGVMEEDEATRRAKNAALNAATSTTRQAPPSSLSRTSSAALYGNQYSQSPRPTGSHQYYGSAQTPLRQPTANLQRPPSASPMPYGGQRTPSATPYRPTAYSTPTYPHQSSRPGQAQYTPSTAQFLNATAGQGYARNPSQPYQHGVSSAALAGVRYPGQPYTQGQGQNGISFQYNSGSGAPRQASPQKPMPYSPQPSVPNRPYGTPTPGASAPRPYQSTSLTSGPAANGSANHPATPYSTFMTPEQTSSLVERQRAQLAQQQGAQQQARNAAQAGAMSVSSNPQVNGGSAVAAGS